MPAFCLLGFVAKTHKIPNIMIEQLLNQAVETALIELESIARTILLENNDLHEFVMSMGCWSFTNNDGNIVDADDERLKPIAAMIGKWDDSLKLTGEPMRFTAGGPKITAWW